jgi:hypothetical protein
MLRHLDAQTSVRIVEMLPSVEETWLIDGDGRRYTSELRFVTRRPD